MQLKTPAGLEPEINNPAKLANVPESSANLAKPPPEAPWGTTADGNPRNKPGPKPRGERPPLERRFSTTTGLVGMNPSTHVKVFARPYTEEAVTILVAIMRDEEASPQVRVSAATQVLDRAWGKPKETLEIDAPQEGLRAVLAGVSSSDLSDLLRAMREAASALPVIEGTAKKT